MLDDAAAQTWRPSVVFVDAANRVTERRPERLAA